SADRHSMTMFFPSTYPRSRSPWRNASMRYGFAERGKERRKPIRGTFVGCCASAITPRASNTIATRIDGAAAFFIARISFRVVIYHADRGKEKRILQGEATGTSRVGKTRFRE